jgi:hypothetical protein
MSDKTSRLLFAAALIFCACFAHAQNVRQDGVVSSRSGQPAGGAFVAVCTQPANTSVAPCSPLAPLCSSLSDIACTQTNPVQADGLGNFHFYAKLTSLPVTIQYFGPNVPTYSVPDQTFGGGNGSGGSPGGSSLQLQYNNAGFFAGLPCTWTNGTSTLACTGTINASVGLNIGTSSPTACTGISGCIALAEASTPCTPTAGQICFRADAINHALKVSVDAGAEYIEFPQVPLVVGAGISTWGTGDIGAQINAAYAALPSTGGIISMLAGPCLTYSTPIVFGTSHKPVALVGAGNYGTCLTYTGTTGAAITVNVGVQGRINRLEDFILTGPGIGTSTTGVVIGGATDSGTNFAHTSRMLIASFGLGMQFVGSNTWGFVGYEMQLNDNGQNFSDTYGQENNSFIGSKFSIDTPGTNGTVANSVQISGSSDWNFYGCSFDNVQLSVSSNAIIHIFGGHFENPASTSYDYFVCAGLECSFNEVLFNQDNASAFANNRFGTASSGVVSFYGGTAFSALSPLGSFVNTTGSAKLNAFGLLLDSSFSGFYSSTSSGTVSVCPLDNFGNCSISGSLISKGLYQPAANTYAGKCAMGATTTCTYTASGPAFGNYVSFASIDQASAPPATAISAKCSLSGTTVTITAGASNSLTWDCLFVGNPN